MKNPMWAHRLQSHTIKAYRVTVPMFDLSAKGWLYRCSCGEVWAK
jgi:hypothetical protein